MAYRIENKDIVIDGWEKGIAVSPYSGIANLQNVNISTETGEVMCSYNRVRQSQTATATLTLTRVNTNTVSFSATVLVGTWITIVADSGTGLTGNYYVVSTGKLSATFAQNDSTIVTGINAGTATFTVQSMSSPVDRCVEPYTDSSGVQQYRYYIQDDLANTWVHDTATLTGVDTPLWFAPLLRPTLSGKTANGINVFNGWLARFIGNIIYWCPTCRLGTGGSSLSGSPDLYPGVSFFNKFHPSLVGNQGKMYWGDGSYLSSIFPNTSLVSGAANIQSYCSYSVNYSSSNTLGLITAKIGGSLPFINGVIRVPVTLFTDGTLPTAIHKDAGSITYSDTIYYLEATIVSGTGLMYFSLYAAATGGAAIDITTGAAGTQYLNTFNPIETVGASLYTFTRERLNLPYSETVQALGELGNQVVIGCLGNVLYPWDQVSPLPSNLIYLPEGNTKKLITINNTLYIFSGNKGNVYMTNGSNAALALSLPDYCAGIAGTPASYIEPYFTWGDVAYCRGRIYFSVLDQTATKTGNCGGIWSFVPSQNASTMQDNGLALRLENQNSYGTYNGLATVLLADMNQASIGAKYWSGWQSTYSGTTYGIDYTDTVPVTTAIIETDLIPTGTVIQKRTFEQVEYKLSTSLASGETVTIAYRKNSTDAYTSLPTVNVESATELSGFFTANFENTQWLQFKITLTSLGTSSSSFVRLKEIRLR